MLAIDAETFKLPMEIPEPAWLHTRFSTRPWFEGLLTETHSSLLVTCGSLERICAFDRGTNLYVMNPVVGTNDIDSIIRSQVTTTNGQVVCLEVDDEVEDNVKLGAVNKDEVVDCSIDWRDETDKPRAQVTRAYELAISSMLGTARIILCQVPVNVTLSLKCSLSSLGVELKVDSFTC